MMHITYTNRQGFFLWNELCCLSRALGFQANTLNNCIPEETQKSSNGIGYKEILKLIELKCFNEVVDRTFNMHTADYNVNVLKKSLKLLDHHLLSFSELNDVRIAFQVYEAADMRGMVLDQHTLMRTLKLCNRTVAPLKLMHRVKHLQESFDEPERIQFYEFLDLLILCDLIPDVNVGHKDSSLEKTKQELYELVDIKDVCTTLDEKIEGQLNSMFMRTERDYGKEHFGDKRIPRESAVETSERKKRVRHHGTRYKDLQSHINNSTRRVQRIKAGYVRERPESAPSFEPSERPHTVDQIVHNTFSRAGVCLRLRPFSAPELCVKEPVVHSVKEKSVSTTLNPCRDPRAILFETYLEHYKNRKDAVSRAESIATVDQSGDNSVSYPPWIATRNRKVQTPKLITDENVEERQDILDNLQYEIETLEERTIRQLYAGLNQIYPTYKERRFLKKSKVQPKQENKKVKKKSRKINLESLDRLSKPEPRAFLAVHDSNCDARLIGSGFKQLRGKHNRRVLSLDDHTSSENLDHAHKRHGSVSSADETSMKTFESSRHSWFMNLHKSTHLHDYDREKYKNMRFGTAAVLYEHFHCDNKEQILDNECNVRKVDDALDVAIDGQHNDAISNKSEPRPNSTNMLHRLLNVDHSVMSNYQSVDPRNAQREKALITRRLNSYDDDELKMNGILLSEIDKLTIKQDLEKVPVGKRSSLPALTTR
ncbi:uncharacterized protein [Antedon mediterranea]|uniref:uncharacterized protein n=1 Tax=Antedon mediterranea TaxID=105859 RepID=UPI003AF9395B